MVYEIQIYPFYLQPLHFSIMFYNKFYKVEFDRPGERSPE